MRRDDDAAGETGERREDAGRDAGLDGEPARSDGGHDPDEHDGGHEHGRDGGHDPDEHDGGHDHDHHHHDATDVAVAVVTVSSSRSVDDDPAGDAIAARLEGGHGDEARADPAGGRPDSSAGVHLEGRRVVPDDRAAVGTALDAAVASADAVVTTGGTGITPDDVTVEVVRDRFEKELPGFGELFRRRSEADVGDRVMATRATAGVVERIPVFCLPGSENAARVGADLLVPQLPHLVGLADR